MACDGAVPCRALPCLGAGGALRSCGESNPHWVWPDSLGAAPLCVGARVAFAACWYCVRAIHRTGGRRLRTSSSWPMGQDRRPAQSARSGSALPSAHTSVRASDAAPARASALPSAHSSATPWARQSALVWADLSRCRVHAEPRMCMRSCLRKPRYRRRHETAKQRSHYPAVESPATRTGGPRRRCGLSAYPQRMHLISGWEGHSLQESRRRYPARPRPGQGCLPYSSYHAEQDRLRGWRPPSHRQSQATAATLRPRLAPVTRRKGTEGPSGSVHAPTSSGVSAAAHRSTRRSHAREDSTRRALARS